MWNQCQAPRKSSENFFPPNLQEDVGSCLWADGERDGTGEGGLPHSSLQFTRYISQNLKTPVFQEAARKGKGISIESESASKDRKRKN